MHSILATKHYKCYKIARLNSVHEEVLENRHNDDDDDDDDGEMN
jgi:hypothetical protein